MEGQRQTTTTSIKSIYDDAIESLSNVRMWVIILAIIMVAYSLYEMWQLWGASAGWTEWILAAVVLIFGIVGIVVYFRSAPSTTTKVEDRRTSGRQVKISEL